MSMSNKRSDAVEAKRQFEQLKRRISNFHVGAISRNEATSLNIKIQALMTSIQLFESNLIMLKSKNRERQMSPNTNLPDYDQSLANLNKQIELHLLHKLSCKSATGSAVLQHIFKKAALNRNTISTDETEVAIVDLIKIRFNMNHKYAKIARMLLESNNNIFEKKKELLKELNTYDCALSTHRDKITKRVTEQGDNAEKQMYLRKLLEKANITRTLIVNIIAASKINLQKDEKWAKLAVNCRQPITLANIQTR